MRVLGALSPDEEPLAQNEENSVNLNRSELLYAIRHDCVAFLSFYLAEELTMEVPDFHEDIWNELLRMVDTANQSGAMFQLQKLFAVPREHAKSTLAKLAVILFLKYTALKFVLYGSKTNSIAKNAIRDILIWLNSPQERELHGPMKTIKSSETESLWIVDIAIRTSVSQPPRYKRCIFKALGADQQVRGTLILNQRPQIIVVDDIEDLDNTTPEQQPGLDEWFMGSFMKCFNSSQHIVIFLGNMIRTTSLLARLSKEEDWNPTVYGSLVRDATTGELRALWSPKYTVEGLLKDYRRYRRLGTGHVWEAEMMNLTQDEVLATSLANMIRPVKPLPEELTAGMLILDPAFGLNSWNDDSAITVHARIEGVPIPCVIDSWKGKATEEETLDRLIELSYYWGISTWVIEAESAQKLLIPLFNLMLADRLLNRSAFLMVPIVTSRTSKASRILAFRNACSGGSYAICEDEEELVIKLSQYSPDVKQHDDLCDSGAYGPIAWTEHGEVIDGRGIQQMAFMVLGDGSQLGSDIMTETLVASF